MKYMAIIDADEKPVSCEFIGCNGNVAPYLIGATTNIEALEQEPCEDAISRETVASEFADWFGYNYQNQIFYKRIKSMPSVNPQPKTGHWTKEETIDGWDGKSYQCSCCGRSIHLDTVMEDLDDYPYCHCGTKMEDGE